MMKEYVNMWKKDGKEFKNPLVINNQQVWNPSPSQLIAAGYSDVPEEEPNMTDLRAAFVTFRKVCEDIGQLLGEPNFKGGFDEMDVFEASPYAKTTEGICLAIRWGAADKRCTYEAKKVGIGQPQWWKLCWGILT